ncbi:hypothetical protein F5883DRAFT_683071 [Diaporthe sp. PMI_573]|nr:hypothetical protein F5883DRAFT_683071 [Diaporthaceae sp. PMI_573]
MPPEKDYTLDSGGGASTGSNYTSIRNRRGPWTTPEENEITRSSSSTTTLRCADRWHQDEKRSSECLEYPTQGRKSPKRRMLSETRDLADEDTHGAQPNQLLACPFSKLDGNRYHACRKFELRRVKDVKQHISRKHFRPEFYCPRCGHTFPDRVRQDEHIRVASCDMQPAPLFEGITDEQRELLKRTVNRGASTRQQWFDVWDILFPDKDRPSSIYLGNFMEETLGYIRNRCQDGNLEARLSTLRNRHGEAVDTELVKDVVTVVWDWFHTVIDNTHAGCESGPVEADTSSQSDTSSSTTSISDLDILHEGVNVGRPWHLTDVPHMYGFEPGGLWPETSYQDFLDIWDLEDSSIHLKSHFIE